MVLEREAWAVVRLPWAVWIAWLSRRSVLSRVFSACVSAVWALVFVLEFESWAVVRLPWAVWIAWLSRRRVLSRVFSAWVSAVWALALAVGSVVAS